jgi:hypothetical protein
MEQVKPNDPTSQALCERYLEELSRFKQREVDLNKEIQAINRQIQAVRTRQIQEQRREMLPEEFADMVEG